MPVDTLIGQDDINTGTRSHDVTSRHGIGYLNQTLEDRGESAPSQEQPPALDEDVAESFLSVLGLGHR